MAEVVVKTISEVCDDAVNELPFLRRKFVQGQFKRKPAKRAEFEERAMLLFAEHPDVQAVVVNLDDAESEVEFDSPVLFAEALMAGTIQADTPFAIDTDKLREILDLLIEYAPKILEIVLTLISLFGAILLLLLLPQSAVAAQDAYVFAPPAATAVVDSQVRFISTKYEDAYKVADEQNLPLLVFVTTDGCLYCEIMWRDTVMPMIKAGELKAVAKVNQVKDQRFNARAFPTLIVYRKTAGVLRERLRNVGVISRDAVKELLLR